MRKKTAGKRRKGKENLLNHLLRKRKIKIRKKTKRRNDYLNLKRWENVLGNVRRRKMFSHHVSLFIRNRLTNMTENDDTTIKIQQVKRKWTRKEVPEEKKWRMYINITRQKGKRKRTLQKPFKTIHPHSNMLYIGSVRE